MPTNTAKTIDAEINANEYPAAARAGWEDGLASDLDSFADRAAVESSQNWDESLINGLGRQAAARLFGVDARDDHSFCAAAGVYDEFCKRGALAPQEERTGLPPGEE